MLEINQKNAKIIPARIWVGFVIGLFLAPVGNAQTTAVDAETAESGYSRRGADTCLACHDDRQINTIFLTPHGNPNDSRTPFAPGNLQCEACHGPGGAHTGLRDRGASRVPMPLFAKGSTAPVEEQNAVCLDCHTEQLGHAWFGSVHETEGRACINCHKVHVEKDHVFSRSEQAEVCYTCHQEQEAQFQKAYAHPVRFGAMTCSSCHNPHDSAAAEGSLNRVTLNQQCYDCHAEFRGPFVWEHAPVSEDCSLCHNPHGSNHPALLVKRPPLLCQSCHSQAGHPSIVYTDAAIENANVNVVAGSCLNCHSQTHGSNHPSGTKLSR